MVFQHRNITNTLMITVKCKQTFANDGVLKRFSNANISIVYTCSIIFKCMLSNVLILVK